MTIPSDAEQALTRFLQIHDFDDYELREGRLICKFEGMEFTSDDFTGTALELHWKALEKQFQAG